MSLASLRTLDKLFPKPPERVAPARDTEIRGLGACARGREHPAHHSFHLSRPADVEMRREARERQLTVIHPAGS